MRVDQAGLSIPVIRAIVFTFNYLHPIFSSSPGWRLLEDSGPLGIGCFGLPVVSFSYPLRLAPCTGVSSQSNKIKHVRQVPLLFFKIRECGPFRTIANESYLLVGSRPMAHWVGSFRARDNSARAMTPHGQSSTIAREKINKNCKESS